MRTYKDILSEGPQKYKRRRTIGLNKELLGNSEIGMLRYPKKLKANIYIYEDYRLRGFYITTHYESQDGEDMIPFTVHFWSFTHSDTLEERIGVHVEGIPVLINEKSITPLNDEPGWVKLTEGERIVSQVRHLICPRRDNLDRYGFDITMFKRDSYIGVPLCLVNKSTKESEEGWVYLYYTDLDGKRGLHFEFDINTPVNINTEDNNIIYYS